MWRSNSVEKRGGIKRTLIVFGFLVGVFAGSFQVTSAESFPTTPTLGSSLAQQINAYVYARICERFTELSMSRPYILVPFFCATQTAKPTVDLSVSPTSVTVGSTAVLSWTSQNANSCEATMGWNGSRARSGSENVSPATTTVYMVTCTNQYGSTSDTATLTVHSMPTQPGLAFSVSPMTINYGSSTMMTWSSVGTTNCFASGGWTGSRSVSGTLTISPATTTAYGLTCTGSGGSIHGTTTVTVVPPAQPTVTLSSNPASILAGATSTLTWASTNATSCDARGGWNGGKILSGSQTISPATTTTYVLTCTGVNGMVSATTTVAVSAVPTPTLNFSASPSQIMSGATSTLSWSSNNVTSCTGSGGWSGSKSLQGPMTVSPATTTSYVLSCSGSGGMVYGTTTIVVTPALVPSVSLVANPGQIMNGASSTLTWMSANVSSCIGAGGWSGSPGLSGSLVVSPATTTQYALTCTGAYGVAAATTTVSVTQTPMPSLSFTASPSSIAFGATSTLLWNSLNTSSCVGSGGWSGSPGLSGSLVVSPATTTMYVLTCTGGSGTISGTSTVTVGTSTPQLFSISFDSSILETMMSDEQEEKDTVDSAVDDDSATESSDEADDSDDESSGWSRDNSDRRSFRDAVMRRVRDR